MPSLNFSAFARPTKSLLAKSENAWQGIIEYPQQGQIVGLGSERG